MKKVALFLSSLWLLFAINPLALAKTDADSLKIENVWIRETPPHLKNTAAYFEVVNTASMPIKLIAAYTPVAKQVQLHQTQEIGQQLKMVQQEFILLEPGKRFTFSPGGYHVMLMDLNQPLKAGTSVKLVLLFSDGSYAELKAPVKKPADVSQPHNGSN